MSLVLVLGASTLFAADVTESLRDRLEQGEVAPAAAEAFGEHVAFDRALQGVLSSSSVPEARRSQLARAVLAVSPVAVPRSFTDGRSPTGWDIAYLRALETAETTGDGAVILSMREVERLLDPDVWKVALGIDMLAQVVTKSSDAPLVAAEVFRCADRIAPFDAYRSRIGAVVDSGLAAATRPGARHLFALAALRVAQSVPRAVFAPRDAELWNVAATSAPDTRTAALTRLAGLRDRFVRGDAAAKAQARAALTREPLVDVPHDVIVARHELIARTAAASGDATVALAATEIGANGDPAQGAALRILVAETLTQSGAALDDPKLRRLVADALEASRATLEGRPVVAALDWWLAELAARDGGVEAQEVHLRRAAEAALAGARARPEEILPTAWWVPLDRPAAKELDPGRLALNAAWILANRLYERDAFGEALRYFELPTPAGGCGNYVVDVETTRAVRMSSCLERLGRIDAARDLLRTLVGANGASAADSSGIVALVEFEARHGGAKGLRAWLDGLAVEDDRAERARLYLEYRSASSEGDTARASAAAARIDERWPSDHVLRARVASKDPPDSDR